MNDLTLLDAIIDWDTLAEKASGFSVPGAEIEIVEGVVDSCDHYPCYEAHNLSMILRLGTRYFAKPFRYTSQDGYEVRGALREVFPKTVTTTTWNEERS